MEQKKGVKIKAGVKGRIKYAGKISSFKTDE